MSLISCFMFKKNFFSNFLIFCLAVWALLIAASVFFGLQIYFPFIIANEELIPYHRWQSVRVAVFLTFAYFGIMHLIRGSKELYPIKFLEIYIKVLTITGLILFYQAQVKTTEYIILLFFLFCSVVLHVAARPKYRKYFTKK